MNTVKSDGPLDRVAGAHNAAALAIARRGGTVTRAGLAEELQVTKQAVSKILGRLIKQGLMAECGSVSTGPGKPVTLYQIVPSSRRAIGLHLTRSRVHGVVVDLTGEVLERSELEIGRQQPVPELISTLGEQALALAKHGDGELVGVGLGMPGPVDWDEGIYRGTSAPDPWRGAAIRQLLIEELGLPVLVDHDSRAALVGEAWTQPGQLTNAALVLVEDGLGAGLCLDGTTAHGAHSQAGEIGHTVVRLEGTPCDCGRRGCAQAEYRAALESGDEEFAARVLATVVLNLVRLVDVDRVVLGGRTFYDRHEISLAAIRQALSSTFREEPWVSVDVSVATRGTDLIAAGAASEVLEHEYGLPQPLAGPA